MSELAVALKNRRSSLNLLTDEERFSPEKDDEERFPPDEEFEQWLAGPGTGLENLPKPITRLVAPALSRTAAAPANTKTSPDKAPVSPAYRHITWAVGQYWPHNNPPLSELKLPQSLAKLNENFDAAADSANAGHHDGNMVNLRSTSRWAPWTPYTPNLITVNQLFRVSGKGSVFESYIDWDLMKILRQPGNVTTPIYFKYAGPLNGGNTKIRWEQTHIPPK